VEWTYAKGGDETLGEVVGEALALKVLLVEVQEER